MPVYSTVGISNNERRSSTMSQGKTIRLKRLIEPQYGSCIICALDHGMTSPNFLDGLYDTRKRTREAIAGGANVFMLGRGISRQVVDEFTPATSLALMLSASAAGRPQGSVVTPVGSVDEALRLRADAVVVYDDAYALYREVYDALQEPFRKAAK